MNKNKFWKFSCTTCPSLRIDWQFSLSSYWITWHFRISENFTEILEYRLYNVYLKVFSLVLYVFLNCMKCTLSMIFQHLRFRIVIWAVSFSFWKSINWVLKSSMVLTRFTFKLFIGKYGFKSRPFETYFTLNDLHF